MVIKNSQSCFDRLSDEIALKIFYNVSTSDLARISSVCRKWRDLVENESRRNITCSKVLLVLIDSIPESSDLMPPQLLELKQKIIKKDFTPQNRQLKGLWRLFWKRQPSFFEEADELLSSYFYQLFQLQKIKTCRLENFVERQLMFKIKKIAEERFSRRFSWTRLTLSLHGFTVEPLYHNLLTLKTHYGPLEIGFPRYDINENLEEEIGSTERAVMLALPEKAGLSVDLETRGEGGVNRSTWNFLSSFLLKRSQSVVNLSFGNCLPVDSPWGEDYNSCMDFLLKMENVSWLSLNLKPSLNDDHVEALCRFLRGHAHDVKFILYDCRLTLRGARLLMKEAAEAREAFKTVLIIISSLLTESDLEQLNREAASLKQKKHEFLFKNRLSST